MATPVYKAEVAFDNVTHAPNTEANPDSRAHFFEFYLEAICKPSGDAYPRYNNTPDYGHFCVKLGFRNSDNTGYMVLTVQTGDAEVKPPYWSAFASAPSITGADPALVTGGGTLTLTKDYDAGTVVATSPLGTITLTLSDVDPFLPLGSPSYVNNHPLYAQGYGISWAVADPTFAYPEYGDDQRVKFYNVKNSTDGVVQETIALSSGDPGAWYTNSVAFEPVSSIAYNDVFSPWIDLMQEATRFRMATTLTTGNFPEASHGTPDYRLFDDWKSRATMGGKVVAMETATEHGILWRAGSLADVTVMKAARSFNRGVNWTAYDVYNNAMSSNSSPSLVWRDGRLYCCWQDGMAIKQANSWNAGATWSTPVTLPYSGTFPRLVAERNHGLWLYFFFDGSGNLKIARSCDAGSHFIDASPTTVLTSASLSPQTVDAEFVADGTIVLTYLNLSNTWSQLKSSNLGLVWS